ncbi:MAG: SgcJ/EcaC family oxidoreductase [Gemmatimonas sp.]
MTRSSKDSEKEVVAVYTRLLEAWNRMDAKEFAALFTEMGSCVGFDGSQMNGRAEIAATLGDIFANHNTAAYVAIVREVRALNTEVTLLRAVVGMVPPGKSELLPARNAVQSLVLAAEADQWRIALLHNTPATFDGRPQLVTELTAELREALRTGKTVVGA